MPSIAPRPWRIVPLALFAGVFLTAQPMLMNEAVGRHMTLHAILLEMLFWVVWAGFTPMVLAAASRWPLGPVVSARQVVPHVVLSVLMAPIADYVYLALFPVWRLLTGRLAAAVFFAQFTNLGGAQIWGFFMGMLYYWALLLLLTVFRFRAMYADAERELAGSKLDALRSQLRPHFLFNTLNAISVLARKDPDRTQAMLLRLSSLLRRSLDEDAHQVPLHRELAFLEDYLDIQRARFGDRLQIRLDVDPAVIDAEVPVFLLQPLVENSLQHGVSDDGNSFVALDARRADGMLWLVLEDDGARGVERGAKEGIGLGNTRARLQQLYGGRATIELSPRKGRGTRVEIRIPM
ncbi:MAG TPA: histidine kinase [Gemmatimonadales bacterium]|jgi:two-component sensor histidine kinase